MAFSSSQVQLQKPGFRHVALHHASIIAVVQFGAVVTTLLVCFISVSTLVISPVRRQHGACPGHVLVMTWSCPAGHVAAVSCWSYPGRVAAVSRPCRGRVAAVSWPCPGRVLVVSWSCLVRRRVFSDEHAAVNNKGPLVQGVGLGEG